MAKPKWIVKSEYTTRAEMEEMYREDDDYPYDTSEYGIEDFQEIEIAVVREDNALGMKSGGWDGINKITLFDDNSFNPPAAKEDIKWCKEVAKTVCEALNRKGL